MKHSWIGKFVLLFFLVFWASPTDAFAVTEEPLSSEQTYLYKTTFIRAAPGKLLDLIDLLKERMPVYDAGGDEHPFWWRHTQGDQWDLMLLYPMGSYAEYYFKERTEHRTQALAGAKAGLHTHRHALPHPFQFHLGNPSLERRHLGVEGLTGQHHV